MTTTNTHRTTAALKLPTAIAALISTARTIVQSMTGNGSFPAPEPALATVTAAINDLETAEVSARGRTKGAVAARNQKRAALVTLLDELKAYVQKVADGDPTHAPAVIESAGMNLRKAVVRVKRVFAAKAGAVSGAVELLAPSAGHRASYEWEYSTDGGKTWQLMPATLQAKTTTAGLPVGSTYAFRYRPVVRTGALDWSEPVSILIK